LLGANITCGSLIKVKTSLLATTDPKYTLLYVVDHDRDIGAVHALCIYMHVAYLDYSRFNVGEIHTISMYELHYLLHGANKYEKWELLL
jgi:hypothetical protein